jgi:hypothetical protein
VIKVLSHIQSVKLGELPISINNVEIGSINELNKYLQGYYELIEIEFTGFKIYSQYNEWLFNGSVHHYTQQLPFQLLIEENGIYKRKINNCWIESFTHMQTMNDFVIIEYGKLMAENITEIK